MAVALELLEATAIVLAVGPSAEDHLFGRMRGGGLGRTIRRDDRDQRVRASPIARVSHDETEAMSCCVR